MVPGTAEKRSHDDTTDIARSFIVRARWSAGPGATTPHARFEIEDVEAGDKRHFITFEGGIAHMRSRIDAFLHAAAQTDHSAPPGGE